MPNQLLEQLEQIRELMPDFGYSGRAGWAEDEDAANWDVEEVQGAVSF